MSNPGPSGGQGTEDDDPMDTSQSEEPGGGVESEEYAIGEPDKDLDPNESVCYSHHYFIRTEIDGVPHAICRSCKLEESQASGRPKKSRVKKKDVLKITGGSTKGLFTHMEAHHEKAFKKMMEQHEANEQRRREKQKRKMDGFTQLKLTSQSTNNNMVQIDNRLDPKIQARWDEAVVEFVCESGVSFEAAQKLDIVLRAIWPSGKLRVKVKHAKTVSRHVTNQAVALKIDVYSLIKAAKEYTQMFAFTTDMWRSRSLDSYMSLTAHYINESWELIRIVPFIQYFGPNRHTGINLKCMMDQFMRVLTIEGPEIRKIVVCDNASNNKVMLRLSEGELEEYYCCQHTIQLCVNDMFELEVLGEKLHKLVDKCNDCAKFVRRSETNKNDLFCACRLKLISPIMPKKAFDVRWHSKEANIDSILKVKPALDHLAQTDESLSWAEVVPNAAETKVIESLEEILVQAKVTSKAWEGEKEPTIQAVIPELWNLKDVLTRKGSSRERYIAKFARDFQKLLEDRFPDCGSRNLYNSTAHYLDPEYQGLILKQFRGAFEDAKEAIKRMAIRYQAFPETAPVGQSAEDRPDQDQNENLSAAQRLKLSQAEAGDTSVPIENAASSVDIEMDKFEKMKINHCSNLLIWWRDNEPALPLLSKVAREVFALPASSASSERCFSVGGMMCSARRSNLNPEKVGDLMMMKLNSKTLTTLKARGPIEPAYTAQEVADLITVNFVVSDNDLETDRRDELAETFIEDIDEELREVNMFDVEDMI